MSKKTYDVTSLKRICDILQKIAESLASAECEIQSLYNDEVVNGFKDDHYVNLLKETNEDINNVRTSLAEYVKCVAYDYMSNIETSEG